MADDWQPGDLALCVDNGPPKTMPNGMRECHPSACQSLRIGAVYVVEAVGLGKSGSLGLRVTGRLGGLATRFQKIAAHTPDAEDAETIRLLRGAPVRVDA